MPRINTYSHFSLSNQTKKKNVLNIDTFLGLDYNLSQLNVADNHAVDMLNIIYKDKLNQKRHGWQQLFQMIETTYYTQNENGTYSSQKSNTVHFNGIWTFTGEDGVERTVAHIGKLLYLIKGIGKGKTFYNCKFVMIAEDRLNNGSLIKVTSELEDIKSKAFYGNRRLYILGGNKYYVLTTKNSQVKLSEVEDNENTYIPTTTVGIVAKESLNEGESSLSRATSLDDVNLMTQYRKNKLVTGTYIEKSNEVKSTRFSDYELDSCVNPKKDTDINNIVITINSLKSEVDS